ncbi:MAG: hypothetical protein EXQ90_01465 [Rhodospirillales bacterium]|nr:hypothetical protein [Rhodospirillales bacterium]
MQVNLYYHKEAFANLEQAFDPVRNVAYAARYPKEMYDLTKSWQDAAGAYHSMDPERGLVYQARVLQFWAQAAGDPAVTADLKVAALDLKLDLTPPPAPTRPTSTPIMTTAAVTTAATTPIPTLQSKLSVPIDWTRTAELNSRLRQARADGSSPRAVLSVTDHVRVMRQAAGSLNDRPMSAGSGRALAVAQADRPAFTENRQLQLKAWRDRASR